MSIIKTSVCIVGGGLTGLTLACSLSKLKIKTILVDTRNYEDENSFNSDGRCSAIAAGSKIFFDKIDIWSEFQNFAGEILDIRVSDGESKCHLHYNYKIVGDKPMGYMVDNSLMLKSLYHKANNSDYVEIISQKKCESFDSENNKITINLENKDKIEAQILFACDGKFSNIRKLAGIETLNHDYKQTGIVCSIKHQNHHHNLAQERFLEKGPFAVLPMHDGYHSSLVWTEPEELAKIYLSFDEKDFLDQIKSRLGDHLGDISLSSKRFSYPLTLVHAKKYVSNRLVLVGDAAHAIHPLAGQGFNLGIRDVELLSEILSGSSKIGEDLGGRKILSKYESKRKLDSHSLIAITTGLNTLFANNNMMVKLARRLGMKTINKLPLVKRSLMSHAMGLHSS